MKRRVLLGLVASAVPILGAFHAVTADSTGTASGDVVAVTDSYVDVKVNRESMRFALGNEFRGVFSADGSAKRQLSDIKPGMFVRVAFIKTTLGSAYRKATEIDILTGYQLPLPLATGH